MSLASMSNDDKQYQYSSSNLAALNKALHHHQQQQQQQQQNGMLLNYFNQPQQQQQQQQQQSLLPTSLDNLNDSAYAYAFSQYNNQYATNLHGSTMQQHQHQQQPVSHHITKQQIVQPTPRYTSGYYPQAVLAPATVTRQQHQQWPMTANGSLSSSSLSSSPSPTLSSTSSQFFPQSTVGLMNYPTHHHMHHSHNQQPPPPLPQSSILINCLTGTSHPYIANVQGLKKPLGQLNLNEAQQLQQQLQLQQKSPLAASISSTSSSTSSFMPNLQHNGGDLVDDDDYDDDQNTDDDDDDDDENNQNKCKSNRKQNRKRTHDGGHLYCCVCGANANGYNFNAITCESCKAFFRRNAFRDLSLFRCVNNNKCDINVNTRKKCKKCRISKCFVQGMNKDWIMNEEERELKKRKIEANRLLKALKLQQQYKLQMIGSNMDNVLMNNALEANVITNEIFKMQEHLLSNDISDYHHHYQAPKQLTHNTNTSTSIVRRRRRRRRRLIESQQNVQQQQQLQLQNSNVNKHDSVLMMTPPQLSSLNGNYSSSHTNNKAFQSYHAIGGGGSSTSGHEQRNDLILIDDEQPKNNGQREPDMPRQMNDSAFDDGTTVSTDEYDTDSDEEMENGDFDDGGVIEEDYDSDDSVNFEKKRRSLRQNDVDLIKRLCTSYEDVVNKIRSQGASDVDVDDQLATSMFCQNTVEINTTLNVTVIGVRRLICFFKQVPDFRDLDQQTQVDILKPNMMDILQIHGAISYNAKSDTFRDPFGTKCKVEYSARSLEATYGKEKYDQIMKLIRNLTDACDSNSTVIIILLLCVLFQADQYVGKNVQAKKHLHTLSLKYNHLLYAYMCQLFSWPDVDIRFKKIVQLIPDVRVLSEEFRKIVVRDVNRDVVNPLMKEVFTIQ